MPAELEHQIVLILTDVLQAIGWGGGGGHHGVRER